MNTTTTKNETAYFMCCSGFCIDLLKKFSKDLGFNYDLTQVEDKKWGTIEVNILAMHLSLIYK